MPESIPDYASQAAVLERKLRALQRTIIGVAAEGAKALEDQQLENLYEAQLEAASHDWNEFQKYWDERDSFHSVISNDTFPDTHWLSRYDLLRNEIIKAKSIMITIHRRNANTSADTSQMPSGANLNTSHSAHNFTLNPGNKSHLPKIPIPQFSGDLIKWTHFKDTFVSMVHNEVALSNVEKFHYLLGALKGEAAALLSRIPIDETSYSLAWEKLIKNYDNPRVIASMFVQRMLECDISLSRSEIQRYEVFLTGVADSIEGFRSLNLDQPSEFLLAALALRALDSETRKQFELSRGAHSQDPPSADNVIEFVRHRMSALKLSRDFGSSTSWSETKSKSSPKNKFPSRSSNRYSSVTFHTTGSSDRQSHKGDNKKGFQKQTPRQFDYKKQSTTQSGSNCQDRKSSKFVCPLCEGCHLLAYCLQFSHLPIQERTAFINGWKGCKNCLRDNHNVAQCPSKWSCRFCKQRHHSLIHEEKNFPDCAVAGPSKIQLGTNSDCNADSFIAFGASRSCNIASRGPALLGTVQMFVKGEKMGLFPIRAILDSGSQNTFMSRSLANRIGSDISEFSGRITGLGGATVSSPAGTTTCSIKPFSSNKEFNVEAIVVESISPPLPSSSVDHEIVKQLHHLDLADHNFHLPGSIDMLIGIDLYPRLVNGAPYQAGVAGLFLQPTVFGLVVMGRLNGSPSSCGVALFTETQDEIEDNLKVFWEVEEPAPANRQNPDDALCEDHFLKTHSRDSEGRYMVRLPRRLDANLLGTNKDLVSSRFCNLERKLHKDDELAQRYTEFMEEYLQLGHMSPAAVSAKYLIPHHGIWQDRPEGRKLRVVFDASCPSTSNSLNEILLAGPKLQTDLGNIIIRFRLYAIPLCADLVKMYRQVLVHPEDRQLQHILWRKNSNDELLEYELNTLTYGVRPSAFAAMRVIKQLILDEGQAFPLAVDRISTSMYVDDIVTGADTIDEAKSLQAELCSLFARGGFSLSKWASNISELIPNQSEPIGSVIMKQPDSQYVKILGLVWNPPNDAFSYAVLQPPETGVTKRVMLSAIARIFDPLGFLSPVILLVKVLLQEVWKAQLDWDDKLTPDISEKWSAIANEWKSLSNIVIPRYISVRDASYMLIGFCDASLKGYAAAIFLRAEDPNGELRVNLIKAKSKVSPVKYMSVARLELCGALLLARLFSSIDIPSFKLRKPYCFTDSKVVLAWLKTPIHLLKVFEANRVSEILDVIPLPHWNHVKSEDNPSDIASRGCLPSQFYDSRLWWHGPSWLGKPLDSWPITHAAEINGFVLATTIQAKASSCNESPEVWMKRFSNYRTLVRTVALILRLAKQAKSRSKPFKLAGHITAVEYEEAQNRCVYLVQRHDFPGELFADRMDVPKGFAPLSPFLDEVGVVRVGGRLHNAPLQHSSKHPMLVPRNSHLAYLIIKDIHDRYFHAGPTLTLALLRSRFWIPGAYKRIRGIIFQCVQCRLQRAKPITPIMATLPKSRFAEFRAFSQVGVDYAGPFFIKESTRRNASVAKAYLCILVCMATKAIHLEAVSSLTTTALLAALDRFFSRRGLPRTVWSDHGTNFVGASRFLKDVYIFLHRNEEDIAHRLAPNGVEWKFIPPRAPHFGGLWEAGVKSVKALLSTSVSKQSMNFEELATTFARIEGILNSRPLCSLNEDVENCDFLTPGHFLIGGPLFNLPEDSEEIRTLSTATRWNLVQAQVRTVWSRWRREYLHSLQVRSKWTQQKSNLKIGDLVIMDERRSLVGHWPVARVVEVYPGKDGVVRTVSIRTPSGKTYMRATATLVPLLPLEKSEENSTEDR